MKADMVCFTTKEEQKELERAIDHGVGKSSFTWHETSLSSCSCQYEKCYGGLPCRHRAAVSQQLGQDSWPLLRETIKPFWLADSLKPATAIGQNEWTTVQPKRTKRSRKAKLMGVAKALTDLASTSDAHTDDVMALLIEKLKSLSLVTCVAAPSGVVVASPPVTARKQNQSRIQPANNGPTTKAASRNAKQQNKQKKQQQKAAKQAAIGE